MDDGHKAHAGLGYEEQAATKIRLALLDKIEPLTQEYRDKLEHIRGAVTHHMYQEEKSWFPDIVREVSQGEQAMLNSRFREKVERYVRAPAPLA